MLFSVVLRNRQEALGESEAHVLGSWFPSPIDGQICFGSFLPNCVLKRGLLFNLLGSNAMRARWAQSVIGDGVGKRWLR